MNGWSDPALAERAAHMDQLVRRYFDGCNEADVEKMMACFAPDAIHYFPPGMYDGPFKGARAIASRWKQMVDTIDSCWTVDTLLIEPVTWKAVMEWTHFKTRQGTILRGIEVYEFDQQSRLITEIRAYYASPQQPELPRQELGGFDYDVRGYPMTPPYGARQPAAAKWT
jgi:hypothetical protein